MYWQCNTPANGMSRLRLLQPTEDGVATNKNGMPFWHRKDVCIEMLPAPQNLTIGWIVQHSGLSPFWQGPTYPLCGVRSTSFKIYDIMIWPWVMAPMVPYDWVVIHIHKSPLEIDVHLCVPGFWPITIWYLEGTDTYQQHQGCEQPGQ